MDEYIEREAVIKARHNCKRNCKECDFAIDGDSWCEGEVWIVDILRIPTADVVSKEQYDQLLRAAKRMHEWIFLNSYDELEAYRECGLTDEDNALLGYIGQMRLEAKDDEG